VSAHEHADGLNTLPISGDIANEVGVQLSRAIGMAPWSTVVPSRKRAPTPPISEGEHAQDERGHLCEQIVESQRKEIKQMEAILTRLDR
jgi:hypothetical protein